MQVQFVPARNHNIDTIGKEQSEFLRFRVQCISHLKLHQQTRVARARLAIPLHKTEFTSTSRSEPRNFLLGRPTESHTRSIMSCHAAIQCSLTRQSK